MAGSLEEVVPVFAAGEAEKGAETPPPGGRRAVRHDPGPLEAASLDGRLQRLAVNVARLTKEFAAQGARLSALEGQMTFLEDTWEKRFGTEREVSR